MKHLTLALAFVASSASALTPAERWERDAWNIEESPRNDSTYIYRTIPGSRVPDRSQPGLMFERQNDGTTYMYRTIPGSRIQDRTQPAWIIDNDAE